MSRSDSRTSVPLLPLPKDTRITCEYWTNWVMKRFNFQSHDVVAFSDLWTLSAVQRAIDKIRSTPSRWFNRQVPNMRICAHKDFDQYGRGSKLVWTLYVSCKYELPWSITYDSTEEIQRYIADVTGFPPGLVYLLNMYM